MSSRTDARVAVLAAAATDDRVVDELLSYDPDGFGDTLPPACGMPLADESFVDTWRGYASQAAAAGIASLAPYLVQLQFPVQAGISQTEGYRAVTRRGEPGPADGAMGLHLQEPDTCRILIHQTWAGSIPIIQTGCRDDFVSILRAFTARNEPRPVPESMGGCMIAGYTNWHRFAQLKDSWQREHPADTFAVERVAAAREQYQDRFIVLSSGWYSDVPPERLGLSEARWQELSLAIRREHECAHYCTRRLFSSMRNSVLDEIIGDACALLGVLGTLRGAWLLAFLGLDHWPVCRPEGRIHSYRGTPPLSDPAFAVLQQLIVAGVRHLEAFTRRQTGDFEGPLGPLLLLATLSQMSVETLASEAAPALLSDGLQQSRRWAQRASVGNVSAPAPGLGEGS